MSQSPLSNRQKKLARKVSKPPLPASATPANAVVARRAVEEEPVGDVIGDAFLREEALAKAAVAAEAADAERRGEKLTAADKKSIRAEYGVTKLNDPDAPAAYVMRSRDGLVSAHQLGVITRPMLKAGQAYRLCYEAQASGLRSGLANAGMVGGGSSMPIGLGARDPAALRRAYLMARLRGMEAGLTPLELTVVRAVVGEGRTLRSLGSGGTAKAATKAALVSALNRIEGGLRITAH